MFILVYPNFELPFIMYANTSNVGIGTIIIQIQDGQERIIAYVSCTFGHQERKYTTIELECLAVV